MVAETEHKLAQLTERVFGVQVGRAFKTNSEQRPVRLAQKRFEIRKELIGRKLEKVRHCVAFVPTLYGTVLKFHDAGSRAIRFKTEWKVTETKKQTSQH